MPELAVPTMQHQGPDGTDAAYGEAVFRGILAASPDCVKVLSAEGRLEFMNARGIELNQLDTADEVLGLNFADLWPEQERDKIREAIRKAAGGEIARAEGFCPTARGEPRWWEASFTPFRPAETGPLKLIGISRDITERVRAHRALRDVNDQLERQVAARTEERDRLWQVSRDMLMVSDLDGVWLSVNPALTRVLGWREDELVGRTSEWLRHPDDQAMTREQIVRLGGGEAVAFENRFRTRAGDYRWMSWNAVPFEGRIYGVIRDVTADKRQAETLRRSETRAAAYFDSSEDYLFLVRIGADGAIRFADMNPACERVMGLARGEIVDRSIEGLIPPNSASDITAYARLCLETGQPQRYDAPRAYRDGQHVLIEGRVTLVERFRGGGGLVLFSGHDVTEQRAVEEALRQSQKIEAIGQLTGGVAHDFNNLLTVIKSSTDLLKRPNLPEERRARYIAAISDTVDRAAKLTAQLLAFARRQALQPKVFDACGGVRMLGDMLGTLTGARIKLVTDLPERPCFVSADPSQFDTALVNMAVNARDAMDGAGRLNIRVEAVDGVPAVRTHPAHDGPFVAISIADTGSGIAPDRLDQVFEPFFTTKEIGKGTGLGLSQVFGFAKQSGGEVVVESTLGVGTTFTLYLPRAAEGPSEIAPADGPNVLTVGHDTCVLVVEDNADVGGFSVQALIELGYLPILAINADEALAELAKDAGRFDVVFSDVVMPGMGGVELAQEIRHRHPDLPVVLTSGYSHVLAKEGTHGFELLHKPYSVEQLARVLQRAMAKA